MIYLSTGKTYQTQSARDAYRIKSGKAFGRHDTGAEVHR